MITKKTLKNGKISVSSSCFDDIRLYRQSLSESIQDDYVPMKWRKEAGRDFSELKFQTTVQCLILAKQGCAELTNFIENLKPSQLENYKINWGPCKEYESYDTLCEKRDELLAEQKTHPLDEDGEKELARVEKEIKSIDDFVERNLAEIRSEKEAVNA